MAVHLSWGRACHEGYLNDNDEKHIYVQYGVLYGKTKAAMSVMIDSSGAIAVTALTSTTTRLLAFAVGYLVSWGFCRERKALDVVIGADNITTTRNTKRHFSFVVLRRPACRKASVRA